jgi:hypothetical protein
MVTVDSLNLSRLDFYKLDIDGGEMQALSGAEETINRCRPIVYCEADKPHMYPDLIPWLHAHDYRIYQHKPRLFNPNNFAGNQVNVFGNVVSLMLLCIPDERKDLRLDTIGVPLERITVGRK